MKKSIPPGDRYIPETVYRAVREGVGLTQQQLGRRSGLGVRRLQEFEYGIDHPTSVERAAIASAVARELRRLSRANRSQGLEVCAQVQSDLERVRGGNGGVSTPRVGDIVQIGRGTTLWTVQRHSAVIASGVTVHLWDLTSHASGQWRHLGLREDEPRLTLVWSLDELVFGAEAVDQ